MTHLPVVALPVFFTTAFLAVPAFAHHSQAAFDASREILIEGKIARLDWKNPHMYLIVETVDADGAPLLVQAEGLSITQALVDGLDREALRPGTPVVMRANPNRIEGKTVRALDVTTPDGTVHPFYAANSRARTLTPADDLDGSWAPPLQQTNAMFAAALRWPFTPAGRAIQAAGPPEGTCNIEPIPFIAMLNELRTIEISDDEIVIRFDNSGDFGERVIHLNAEHPADIEPSRFGHAIGRWEDETLVIDTVGFEPNVFGLFAGVPSSPAKHTVERLTLTEDRLRLRYESTV
ncbi:MAG: DUF6152 family protein, partial [Pseudomonadota bacterium]